MSLILIRHGKTPGNLAGRYIGCRTDEGLCAEGIAALKQMNYPSVRRVICSPMKRCLETAEIIYPRLACTIVPDFRECDFGDFEGKSHAELNGRADYQAWIDSGGALPFPGGESRSSFSARAVRAFEALLPGLWDIDTALVVHGGTVMAIMEAYANPRRSYFDYQVHNGAGFILNRNGTWKKLTEQEKTK